MQTAIQGPRERRYRTWGKKLPPAELQSVFRDYDGGMTCAAIQEKYGVSKTTLYRWINEYEVKPEFESDPAYLRARVASLEKAVLMLTQKLAETEVVDEPSRVHSDSRFRGPGGLFSIAQPTPHPAGG